MNSRLTFLRFIIAIGSVLLVSGILIPRQYNLDYPATLGPIFDPDVKSEHIQGIRETEPDIILLGDSVLYQSVNPELLAEGLKMPIYEMATPGSGTAAWYLQMKNIIFDAPHLPKYIVIFFRNTMLTVPQYRTTGRYFALLDDYATKNEPLVIERAFISQMTPLEKFAQKYIPLYTAREEIRQDMDNALRYLPTALLLNCDRPCTDDAVSSIFGREVDPVALNLAQEDAAKTLYAEAELSFEDQIDSSLLLPMIELAQKNGVKLIFVRSRVYGPEPEMSAYRNSLDTFLTGREGVYLLNYWNDPRIFESYYVDSLHMNSLGMEKFTEIFMRELGDIVLQQ